MEKQRKPRRGQVVTYSGDSGSTANTHESITRSRMAAKLAALLGYEFAGEYDRSTIYDTLYFVPAQTLLRDEAKGLGIRDESHLFGGCVGVRCMGTKSVVHALLDVESHAPAGWCSAFPQAVHAVVLHGYTAFTAADARRACAHLLRGQRVRVKPALGVGGCGQTVVETLDALDAAIAALDVRELMRYGVALEQDLDDVRTFSVGTARVDGIQIAYHGEQHLTSNHQGKRVYGGSTLHVVRGDLRTLAQLDMTTELAAAVAQAIVFDRAAGQHLDGFLASRRNYDIARGIDCNGDLCAGVLEQSWRIGGASPAEITAMEAFAANPQLRSIDVSTHEVYTTAEPPPEAVVFFHGLDPGVGAIAKYCLVHNSQ